MPEPLENLRKIRLEKLEKIKKLGIDPYPASWDGADRREPISAARRKTVGKEGAVVAGRLMGWREHGGITFADLRDESGQIQLVFKSDHLPPTTKHLLELLDIGDFVGVEGILFKTDAGELSIEVKDLTLLAKSLRPLPSSWHGLKDIEERYRKRYLDLLMNPEIRKRFDIRTKLVSGIRHYLDNKGYFEVETPTLQSLYGGANARPFITHHNALDVDFYLRIADELYLKRLIVGGYEKVYEICKDFRNEGIDQTHNPEFTMIEFYEVYAGYQRIMDLTEGLFRYLAKTIFGASVIEVHDKKINIGEKWPRVEMVEVIRQHMNLDAVTASKEELVHFAKKNNLETIKDSSRGQLIFDIFENLVVPKLIEPIWVIDYPQEISPLSKASPKNEGFVERFEGFVGGEEICDGWSEINDPIDQRRRFEHLQVIARTDAEKAEAHPIDKDFIEALEYGMPPLGGIGIGIDRLTMFFTNTWSIKEVILFPTLRPEKLYFDTTLYPSITKKQQEKEMQKLDETGLFIIESKVKEMFPNLNIGVAVIKDVEVKKETKELEEYKKQIVDTLEVSSLDEISKLPSVQSYRDLFKKTGVDYHSRRPSVEALLRRVVQGKKLYRVNTAVDAYNIAVLQSKISLGAFDLDEIVLPKVLRFAKEGEAIILLGETKPTVIHKGELIYADQEGPLTLDLNYRDCDRTKVTAKTRNILLIADGCGSISREDVSKALDLGCELITRFTGGKATHKFIVN